MQIKYPPGPRFGFHIISGSSLRNLWNVLADNRFAIRPRFVPMLLLSMTIVLLNIPFALLEILLYGKKIRNSQVKAPVFILGYPRSGTTYLMYLMSKDPQFAFCRMYECMGPHVLFTFGRVLRFIADRMLPKKRPMDNLELGADVPKEEEFALANMGVESMANAIYFPRRFSEYFDRFVLFRGAEVEKNRFEKNLHYLLRKLTLKNNGKRLLLKSPFNTGRIALLLQMYPDAKFIHIHRHPYSLMQSNAKLYESVLPQVAFQVIDGKKMEEHIAYTYLATMDAYFNDKALLDQSRLFEVGYADFVADPVGVLRTAYDQLQLGGFESALSHFETEAKGYADYKANVHQDDKRKRELYHRKFGEIYERLGYGG
jgi:hypothetical protein